MHEVIHEAPIIHQVKLHDPVPIEHFKKQFGTLEGVSKDKIIEEVLGNKKGVREGEALDSFGDMNLGKKV